MKIKMTLKSAIMLAIASIFAFSAQLTATAHESEALEERHELMTGLGKSMKAFSNYLKRGDGEPLELAAMAEAMAEAAGNIKNVFPPNTGMEMIEDSEAKSNIWEEWDDFVAAAETMGDYADAAEEAFESGDKGKIAEAVGALGKQGCGGCHKRFREKKDG